MNPNAEIGKAWARRPSAGARRLRRFTVRMVLNIRALQAWRQLKRLESRAPGATIVSTSDSGMQACLALLLLLASGCAVLAADFPTLCADRAAIERVYYEHRLGT